MYLATSNTALCHIRCRRSSIRATPLPALRYLFTPESREARDDEVLWPRTRYRNTLLVKLKTTKLLFLQRCHNIERGEHDISLKIIIPAPGHAAVCVTGFGPIKPPLRMLKSRITMCQNRPVFRKVDL